MPLLAISPTQVKAGLKFLIKEGGYLAGPALEALLAGHLDTPSTDDPHWRRWVCVATRATPVGTVEDKAQFKLDLINITSGDIDVTWTSGDYAAVKALFDTYLTTLQALTSSNVTFSEYRAYRMQFNPVPDLARPFLDTGAPEYTATISKVGTGNANLTYQVAASITLKTGLPRHWGRMYLPTPGVSMGANGRWGSSTCTGWAAATRTLLDGLVDAGFWPVVPMTAFGKLPYHALMGIEKVQVDDVPDVQRRRRPKQAAIRALA